MLTRDLEYDLPPALVATKAAEPRDAAKLMVVRRDADCSIEHRHVRDLATNIGESTGILQPGDLLVFNQSRVLPAFLEGVRMNTGGRVTGLYLESAQSTADHAVRWRVMLESRGKLQVGEHITLDDNASLELIEGEGGGQWIVALHANTDTFTVLNRVGQTPLPPYIQTARRKAAQAERTPEDQERYNTVYATDPGSVAAPTAGLHFTDELLASLDAVGIGRAFVTLHVGLGTFAPVRAERVEEHNIHSEWINVPAATIAELKATRDAAGRIIPVGTTTVRALESLPDNWRDAEHAAGYSTDTSLYITPPEDVNAGYPFRFTDALMTNFHLPRSTLLALVAALPSVGLARLKDAYRVAIENEYRFYSYGDAMIVL